MSENEGRDKTQVERGRELAEVMFGDDYAKCLSRRGLRVLYRRYNEGVFYLSPEAARSVNAGD